MSVDPFRRTHIRAGPFFGVARFAAFRKGLVAEFSCETACMYPPAKLSSTLVEGLRRLLDKLSEYPLTVVISMTPRAMEVLRESAPWFANRVTAVYRIESWAEGDIAEYASRAFGMDTSRDALDLILHETKGNPSDDYPAPRARLSLERFA